MGKPSPALREEEGLLAECRKTSTHTAKSESTGKFVRKGGTLHSVVSEAE